MHDDALLGDDRAAAYDKIGKSLCTHRGANGFAIQLNAVGGSACQG